MTSESKKVGTDRKIKSRHHEIYHTLFTSKSEEGSSSIVTTREPREHYFDPFYGIQYQEVVVHCVSYQCQEPAPRGAVVLEGEISGVGPALFCPGNENITIQPKTVHTIGSGRKILVPAQEFEMYDVRCRRKYFYAIHKSGHPNGLLTVHLEYIAYDD